MKKVIADVFLTDYQYDELLYSDRKHKFIWKATIEVDEHWDRCITREIQIKNKKYLLIDAYPFTTEEVDNGFTYKDYDIVDWKAVIKKDWTILVVEK